MGVLRIPSGAKKIRCTYVVVRSVRITTTPAVHYVEKRIPTSRDVSLVIQSIVFPHRKTALKGGFLLHDYMAINKGFHSPPLPDVSLLLHERAFCHTAIGGEEGTSTN